jgi:hypothetical protein
MSDHMSRSADDLEVLMCVATEPEAALIIAALKGQGIDAAAEGALTSAFRAEAPGGVRILVRQGDLDRAKEALADYRRGISDIDWPNIDVGQPE